MDILGLPATIQQPIPSKRRTSPFARKPYARVIVEGVNHPKGKPIRFKSIKKAETYLRQKGLAK